jgi:NADH-quinone oxidoreductase subunit J
MVLVQSLFWGFASLLVVASGLAVFSRQLIHSALWLVLTFLSAAALWLMLQAEFLGLVLVLVYVGAVMTLFLFAIMTLPLEEKANTPLYIKNNLGLPILLVGLSLCIFFILYQKDIQSQIERLQQNRATIDLFQDRHVVRGREEGIARSTAYSRYVRIAASHSTTTSDKRRSFESGLTSLQQEASNTQQLGKQLYTDYCYPFELAGLLLLLAIVACISLTKESRSTHKKLSKSQQIQLQRERRIRLVALKPREKPIIIEPTQK